MKKGLKIPLYIIVILLILGTMARFAYIRYKDKINILKAKKHETINLATPVAVFTAKRGMIRESLRLNGNVVSKTEVNIFSTVPGKVKKIMVIEGDEVKKGQVLAYIDRSEAGLVYAPTPVESTINGIIKKIMIEKGAYISPQMPLIQVINMDEVEVVVNVPEGEISRVRMGLLAETEVIAYPGKIFYGRIYRISPVVNPVSRTLETRIIVNNRRHQLKPGMFGYVTVIVRKKKNALLIPISAVVEREGRTIVYVVRDGKAHEVVPIFGIREEERISVVSGINEGDRVVVIGQQNLNEGDMVNVTEEVE